MRKIQLGSYIYAEEKKDGVVGVYCELLKVKQTIFLTPTDIQNLYETFVLADKDPKDLQNQEDERAKFITQVWEDRANPN